MLGTEEKGRLLVIAPHADDEVLGCGGLMARAAAAGWEINVAYATIAGYASAARGDRSSTETRHQEARRALSVLGVRDHSVLFEGDEHHLRLDVVPQHEIVCFVEAAVRRWRPSLACVPCSSHPHQDHRAVATACAAALRPVPPGSPLYVPMVFAYGHAAWGALGETHAFLPAVTVDITDVLARKIEALRCYETQICPSPHPRSAEAIRAQAQACGTLAGVSAAETFECVRWWI